MGEFEQELSTYVKMVRLGHLPPRELLVPIDDDQVIANPYSIALWERFGWPIQVIRGPGVTAGMRSRGLPTYDPILIFAPNGKVYSHTLAITPIQHEWETKGHGPLLSFPREDEDRAWRILEQLGIPRGERFVTLHSRDAGYNNAMNRLETSESHRNQTIEKNDPAVSHVQERGFWVIRLGHPNSPPYKRGDRFIDYAHSDSREPFMDIFLLAKPWLFFGTSSGPSSVAFSFGTPFVGTNWIAFSIPPYSQHDIFLPKLLWSKSKNRLLSFEEMLSPPMRHAGKRHLYQQEGVEAIENEPDEILEMVRQKLDELDGRYQSTPEALARQQALRRLFEMTGSFLSARVSDHFLAKHQHLFDPPAS
jgi:putative glycosyltransferase (TIGR04372 family)